MKPLYFDREPIDTAVTFEYNNANNIEEDPTMKMTVDQYVTHCIQHTEGYPEIGEISLESAELAVWNRYPDPSLPKMTAEEFREAWNRLVKDPAVMGLYDDAIEIPDLEKFHLTVDSFGSDCPNNWQEIAAFLNAKIDERIMAAHLTPEELEEEGRNIANDVWDDFGAGLFDGECPAPIDEGELSLDNGRTFMTRDDIEVEGLDAILAAHPAITWSVIVNAMDDETREAVAAELAPCSEEEFLLRYLELAPADLVIG